MTDILCFGDSITKGKNDPQGGWPQRVNNFLSNIYINDRRMPRHNVYNLGIDGDTSKELLARIDGELQARSAFGKPITLISIGANDSSQRSDEIVVTGEEYAANLREIITIAEKGSRSVAILGMLPCQDDKLNPVSWSDEPIVYSAKNLRAYDRLAHRIAEEQEIMFFEMFNVFGGLDLDTFLADGLHPNSAGQQYIADRVKKWVATQANNYAKESLD